MTPEQLKRAEERLLNPALGSKCAVAREYGIDLTLLLEQLRLTPAERAEQMMEVCEAADELRGRALQGKR
jgi:hypothetical protein